MKLLAPALGDTLETMTLLPQEDVDNARFVGLTLDGRALPRQEFSKCMFERCTLTGDFERCAFVDVIFDHCDLSGLRGESAAFQRVSFRSCRLMGASLALAALRNVTWKECKATYLNVSGASMQGVAFTECQLEESAWEQVTWRNLTMTDCDLTRAVFHQTALAGLDLRTDRLDGIIAAPASLRGAIVTSMQALVLARLLEMDIRD